MQESFKSLIDSAKGILVLLPKGPYFDQIAAGLSLYLSLRNSKNVDITCPSDITVEFNRLIGVDRIKKEVGSKNLTLRFVDYPANNIERVSYDIENGQFRLTIIPKAQQRAPDRKKVRFSYSGISADTTFLIGGANEDHFPILSSSELSGSKIAHLGTKELSVSQDKGIMSFARPASSASEIIGSLLRKTNAQIDQDIATNLLMGIEEGSNKFSSSETTADTFELVAFLMRQGGRRREPVKKETFPQGAIPGEFRKASKKGKVPEEWKGPKIYKGDTIS